MDRKTLGDYLEDHLARREGRVDERTVENERIACQQLVTWWDSKRLRPEKLDNVHFDDFLHGPGGLTYKILQNPTGKEKMLPTSYNQKIVRLKPFITFLVMRSVVQPLLLETLKDAKYRNAKSRPTVRLSLAQLDEVVNGAEDPWEKFILAAFAYTAGREGELLDRLIVHIGSDNRIDWYRHKTEDEDRLPVLPELDTAVREWLTFYTSVKGELQGDWHLVPMRHRTTGPWTYHPGSAPSNVTVAKVVKKHVARVLKVDAKSDLVGQACHIMRRSAALAMYKALVAAGYTDAIRIVMSWLGHTKMETTELYLGLESGRERRDEVLLNGNRWLTPDQTNVVQLPRLAAVGD